VSVSEFVRFLLDEAYAGSLKEPHCDIVNFPKEINYMLNGLLANFFTDPLWANGFLYGWQIPCIILLIAIIIFWVQYRKKQM
jgi:hypothetical protein